MNDALEAMRLMDRVERGANYTWDGTAWIWTSGNPKHPRIVYPSGTPLWKRIKHWLKTWP